MLQVEQQQGAEEMLCRKQCQGAQEVLKVEHHQGSCIGGSTRGSSPAASLAGQSFLSCPEVIGKKEKLVPAFQKELLPKMMNA